MTQRNQHLTHAILRKPATTTPKQFQTTWRFGKDWQHEGGARFFSVQRLHGFRQVVSQVCTCRKLIVRSMQCRRLGRLQKRASVDLYIVHIAV